MAENQEPTKTEEELAAEAQAEQEALAAKEAEEAKAAEEAAAAKAKEAADKKKAAAKKPAKKEKLFYSPTSGAALTARPDGTFVDPKTNEVFTEAYINEVSNDEIATAQVNVNPDTSNEALVNPQPVSNFAGAPNGDNSGKVFAS